MFGIVWRVMKPSNLQPPPSLQPPCKDDRPFTTMCNTRRRLCTHSCSVLRQDRREGLRGFHAGTACFFDTACWHTAMHNTSCGRPPAPAALCPRPLPCVALFIHCFSLFMHCLSLLMHCLSSIIHSLLMHCHSLLIHWPSVAHSLTFVTFTAFRWPFVLAHSLLLSTRDFVAAGRATGAPRASSPSRTHHKDSHHHGALARAVLCTSALAAHSSRVHAHPLARTLAAPRAGSRSYSATTRLSRIGTLAAAHSSDLPPPDKRFHLVRMMCTAFGIICTVTYVYMCI